MSLDTPDNREALHEVRKVLEQAHAKLAVARGKLEEICGEAVPTIGVRDEATLLIYEAEQKVAKLHRRIDWRLGGREFY